MASTSGGGHGGKRRNAGRKRKFSDIDDYKKEWSKTHQRISVEHTIFQSFLQAKFDAGYAACSDSAFVAHLLSLEYRRRALQDIIPSTVSTTRKHMTEESEGHQMQSSTPINPLTRPLASSVSESPIVESFQSPDRDSTVINTSRNLFADDEDSLVELDESTSSEGEISYQELFNSAIQELHDDKTIFDDSDAESEETELEYNKEDSSGDGSWVHDLDLTEDTEEESNIEETTHCMVHEDVEDAPEYGPHLKLSRGKDLFQFRKEVKMVKERKAICSVGLLLELFSGRCQTPGCSYAPEVKYHFVGTTVVVTSLCQAGHSSKFASSREVNGIYANNLHAVSAILLSGNNFSKVSRMAEFLGLAFVSESTFYRMQRLYLFPAVDEWWCWMREELVKEFVSEKVVVGGDGQCDSPGFSAKNLCYFLMEITSSYILEIEVRDKRHVGLASTNMEKVALKNALTRVKNVLDVVELATDASSSIKKLVANEFKGVFHSLDVWHKSKSIRKCLTKIGQAKPMQKIKAWTDHIIRHFWYCSSVCRPSETTSDEEALEIMKSKWIGLLHHVCDDHEWLGGKCEHEEGVHYDDLPWFDRRDKDDAELQKIILNPELLDSFKYYVRFRHTGSIECANSLTLVYTPKRTPFSYRAYKARKCLAVIDWNFHLGLSSAKNKSGNEITSRRYNQRTKQWDVRTVKTNKGYEYIPLLMAKIFNLRMEDIDLVTRNVSLNASDPRLLAPTIAAKAPPSSKELLKRRSRFSLGSSTTDSDKSSDTPSAREH